MGDLLEEDEDADPCQHALDDRRWEVVADDACAHEAKGDLEDASEHHGDQEDLKGAELVNGAEHDDSEARSRSGDAGSRAAEGAHDDASDDAGDDARDQRRARGQRDAEAERKGDQEDNDRSREVLTQ